MADDTKHTDIKVSADTSSAKASLNEILRLSDSLQKNIDRAFKSYNENNGHISDKQLTNALRGFGILNDMKASIQNQQNKERLQYSGKESDKRIAEDNALIKNIDKIVQQIRDNNQQKLGAITDHSHVNSSRNFYDGRGPTNTINADGKRQTFDELNLILGSKASDMRSTIHNSRNTVQRELGRLHQGVASGYISYNRMQEYRASLSNQKKRHKELAELFNGTSKGPNPYKEFQERFKEQQVISRQADVAAKSDTATADQVKYAAAQREELMRLTAINKVYEKLKQEFDRTGESIDKFSGIIDSIDSGKAKVTIGTDPNSIKGILKQRGPSIARGAIASAIGAVTSQVSRGASLRLAAFDNIKSTAYATGIKDNKVLNQLGSTGYQWGYSGADMGQFANAYTGSTGNVGSLSGVRRVAGTWAEQSRITGGSQQSTLSLEQAAGNSANLNSSQMSSVGNAITNAITSSGMSAKASEQQQGLSMLFQNGAAYGMNANDEKQMAGMQASLAKYGSQFQGTQGAQTINQLTSGLGNYNNPGMRQLFAQANPNKYAGVDGAARLDEDMQNMSKHPRELGKMLTATENSFGGDKQQAADYISRNTNVPIATVKKLMKANDEGALNKSTIDKYLNDSSQANKNKQNYDKSGGATLQKYNAALANSAMKASQALDAFTKALAGYHEHTGALGMLASSFATGIGSGLVGIAGPALFHGIVKGRHGGFSDTLRNIFKGGGPKGGGGAREAEKATEKATEKDATRVAERGIINSTKGKVKTGLRSLKGAKGRIGKRLAEHEAARMAGKVGKKGIKGVLKGIPGLGTIVNGGFAVSDLLHGDIGNTALDILGMIPGVGDIADVAQIAGAGDLVDKGLKGKLKGMSLKDAKRKARRLNKTRGFGKKAAKYGIIGATLGLGTAGLVGLSDYFSNTAHASSRKQGDTQEAWKILRGYNKMLDHAMRVVQAAKSIKNGGDSSKSDDGGDISGTGGKGDKAIRSIAKAVAKKLGVDPKLVYAQLAYESTDGTSQEAVKDNNFAGIKGSGGGAATDDGGIYQHFNSTDDFANAYANILRNDGVHSGMSVEDWANTLHAHHYFTDDPSHYAAGLKTYYDKYATGGIRYHATGGPLITDIATTNNGTDVYGEAGTEAYVPLNAGHYQDGLSTIQQLAGMFGKKLVDQSKLGGNRATTINPSYNINLTIQGGTDDAQGLAQTVANKVRQMLQQYDNSQQVQNQQMFYSNETSGLFA